MVEPRKLLQVPSPRLIAWAPPLSPCYEPSSPPDLDDAARILVLLRGTVVAQASSIVTIEYSTKLNTRSRRRAHESVDCILKNSDAFLRPIENLVVERREK